MIAVLVLLTTIAEGADLQPLVRARSLYNAGNYDAAIEAATEARRQPADAVAAGLVLARAYVERYRASLSAADLTAAREALRGVTRARLGPRDQVDLLVALGQVLFYGDTFGAAAEMFDAALARASILPPPSRAQLLDWWANAIDRQAQTQPPDRRAALFTRMMTRMEQELRDDPVNAPANYWLPAAIRGTGDLDRAWDAAIAAWVRTSLDPQTALAVRADLDRLVQTMVGERARQRPAQEQPEVETSLQAQWEAVKTQW
jgi:hypothetical protein